MATASTVMITAVVESFLITRAFTKSGSLNGRTFLLVISTLATPAKSCPDLPGSAGCLSWGFDAGPLDLGKSLASGALAADDVSADCLNSPNPTSERARHSRRL